MSEYVITRVVDIPPSQDPDLTKPWQVFQGSFYEDDPEEEPEGTWRSFDTWRAAHRCMLECYSRWVLDECPHCATHAAQQLPDLINLLPGQEWQGEVEGDEYHLMLVVQ